MFKCIKFARLSIITLRSNPNRLGFAFFALVCLLMCISLSAITGEMAAGVAATLYLATASSAGSFTPGRMDILYTTMPIHPKTIVIGRFINTTLGVVVPTLFAVIPSFIGVQAGHAFGWIQDHRGWPPAAMPMAVAIAVCMLAIKLPLMTKGIPDKTSIFIYLEGFVYSLFVWCIVFYMQADDAGRFVIRTMVNLLESMNQAVYSLGMAWVAAVIVISCAILFPISCAVSLRFYRRREF